MSYRFSAVSLLLAAGALAPGASLAHNGVELSSFAQVTPTIDGTVDPGEWDDAATTPLVFTSCPAAITGTIYVKNDATQLYLAMKVEGMTFANATFNDFFAIFFDDDHNGSKDAGENAWDVLSNGSFVDAYSQAPGLTLALDTPNGGTTDIQAALRHSFPVLFRVGDYTMEFSGALDSGDTHDFALAQGDTVGMAVQIGQDCIGWWTSPFAGAWANVTIADPPTVAAINLVAALPTESVTTSGNQTALIQLLQQAIASLQAGNIERANSKLEAAIVRTDGCAQRGSPDGSGGGGGSRPKQDYITRCADQDAIYPLLVAALGAGT